MVIFLRDIVEEIVATVDTGGLVLAAVDKDRYVGIRDGVVVAGVEEEVAIGEVDEELASKSERGRWICGWIYAVSY